MKIFKTVLNKDVLITLFVLVTVFSLNFNETKTTNAESHLKELSGYAWSSNVGWISMNCRNNSSCSSAEYKVIFNETTRNLSGYAWSSNVGWLQFGGLSGFPSGAGRTVSENSYIDEDGNLKGWARFIGYDRNESGTPFWDGWVSLSDGTGTYGPREKDNEISGYSWGSNVVGWITFNHSYGQVTIEDATAQCGPADEDGNTVDSINELTSDSYLCNIGDPTEVLQSNQDTWDWNCVSDKLDPSKNSSCNVSCEIGKWICDDSCIPLDQSCGDEGCPEGYVFVDGECSLPGPVDPNNTSTAAISQFEVVPSIIKPGESCNLEWTIQTTNANLIRCSITSDYAAHYEDNIDSILPVDGSGIIKGKNSFNNVDATTQYTLACIDIETGASLDTPQTARCLINPNFQDF